MGWGKLCKFCTWGESRVKQRACDGSYYYFSLKTYAVVYMRWQEELQRDHLLLLCFLAIRSMSFGPHLCVLSLQNLPFLIPRVSLWNPKPWRKPRNVLWFPVWFPSVFCCCLRKDWEKRIQMEMEALGFSFCWVWILACLLWHGTYDGEN